MKEKLTYTQAKQELEEIVTFIEAGEASIDTLNEKVSRAAYLITFCKEKLTRTDKELQKIIDDIS